MGNIPKTNKKSNS